MQAPWLLLIETDYVWMKPLHAPPAHNPSSKGMAYPFNYIIPLAPSIESVMRKMFPAELGPLSAIPGSGPAPVMMRFDEWLQVSAHFLCEQLWLCDLKFAVRCTVVAQMQGRSAPMPVMRIGAGIWRIG